MTSLISEKLDNMFSKHKNKIKEIFLTQPGFAASGLFYGFPICCVESFVNFKQLEVFEKYPNIPSSGTGFVPCICCAKNIHTLWPETLNIIAQNRFCTNTFPEQESNKDEADNFFIMLSRFLGLNPKEMAETLSYNKNILKLLKKEKQQTLQKKETLTDKDIFPVSKIEANNAIELIQQNLSEDLLQGQYTNKPENAHISWGLCSVATEALYFMLGGPKRGLTSYVAKDKDGTTHWWLQDKNGMILDPTKEQYTTLNEVPPYERNNPGKPCGFMGMRVELNNQYGFDRKPSKRASILLDKINAQTFPKNRIIKKFKV
jgi:uncharacterized protein YegP (UPF0339 family)